MSSIVCPAYDLGKKDIAQEVASNLHKQILNTSHQRILLPWPTRPKDIPNPESEIPSVVLNNILHIQQKVKMKKTRA